MRAMSIDPRVRVVCLVVFGGAMALGSPAVVLVGAALVACGYVAAAGAHIAAAWKMMKRMRWIFLSIVVFYFWFTPGHPFPGADSRWLPTAEGVRHGALRLVSLAALILAVNLLLQTTQRDALLGALLWALRPLRRVGLDHERFAVRMTLALNAVPRVQAMIPRAQSRPGTLRERAAALGAGIGALFARVMDDADRQPLDAIELVPPARVGLVQWLLPVALIALFALARAIDRLG
jgi:energy-coupling factor transporter transmembrane protein EcfT